MLGIYSVFLAGQQLQPADGVMHCDC